MSRLLIEEVKTRKIESTSWSPMDLYAIKYSIDGNNRWFYIDYADGFLNFYASEKDITDNLFSISEIDDSESDEFKKLLAEREELQIKEFCGISLSINYNEINDIIPYVLELENNEVVSFLKYALSLIVCTENDEKGLIEYGTGKYSDEIYIPLSTMTK